MNTEIRSALLHTVKYLDVEALLRFPPSLFQGEEIVFTYESNGARLPLLAMGIQEVCTLRLGRSLLLDNWDDFLKVLVTHCNLDVNKPFQIHRDPSAISKHLFDTHRYPDTPLHMMQTMERGYVIHTNPLSWMFYLYIEKKKRLVTNYSNCIKSLIHLGANLNSPFFFQTTDGCMNPVVGDGGRQARNGHSFLHFTLESGDYNLLRYLLHAKAKFNLAHDRGSLAKSLATVENGRAGDIEMYCIFRELEKNFKNGNLDAAELQVLRSADPTNGNTPFHYLALYEKFQDERLYIDFLLDILASPFAKNHAGFTPLQVLESTGTVETVQKAAFRKGLVDAMQRWGNLVMRTMVTQESLEARGLPKETQENIYHMVSGAPGSMSTAASVKEKILASRRISLLLTDSSQSYGTR